MSMLDANWLRAASRSIRDRSPRLYAALNRVRNRALSRGTGLSAYQAKALAAFRKHCLAAARDSRVLEIGSDVKGEVLGHIGSWGVRAVGVNPDPEMWDALGTDEHRLGPRAVVRRADATALPFDDASFDAIFSVATFEHILDLPRALSEMKRVLRPGAAIYSLFGPIWSGGRGHHIRVTLPDVEFRHFRPETNPLPDHVHLVLDRHQLRRALGGRVPAHAVEAIVAWVYDSPGINRLFWHEYEAHFAASGLELEHLRVETDPVAPQLARLLSFRHPQERRFDVTNAEVVLRRPS